MSFLLNNTTKQTSSSTGSTTGTTNLSSSSTPTFSPDLQALMKQLLSYSGSSMTDPTAAFAPVRNAGLQQINQAYAGVPGQVAKQMASRGYGSSGAAGDAMYRANLARAGSVSSFEGDLAQKAIEQQNFGSTLGMQLLNAGRGTSTTSSGTTAGTSSSSGTETTTKSGLGEILSNLAKLLMAATFEPA